MVRSQSSSCSKSQQGQRRKHCQSAMATAQTLPNCFKLGEGGGLGRFIHWFKAGLLRPLSSRVIDHCTAQPRAPRGIAGGLLDSGKS